MRRAGRKEERNARRKEAGKKKRRKVDNGRRMKEGRLFGTPSNSLPPSPRCFAFLFLFLLSSPPCSFSPFSLFFYRFSLPFVMFFFLSFSSVLGLRMRILWSERHTIWHLKLSWYRWETEKYKEFSMRKHRESREDEDYHGNDRRGGKGLEAGRNNWFLCMPPSSSSQPWHRL